MAAASEVALYLAEARRREFRRLLVASVIAHAIGVVLLVWTPRSQLALSAPGVIAVELVGLPAAAPPAPKAPPRAAPPKPTPPPPKPQPKKIVLPKEPVAAPSKPKPVAPKPAEPVKPVEPPPPEAEPEEKDLADVLADLRTQVSDETELPPEAPAPAPAPALGTGSAGGVRVSPEVAAWMRRAKIHVRKAWVVPPGFRTQPLETHVTVELDAGGGVVGTPNITRRSGNPWYDEGVTRAIEKASPLPAPPEAGEWAFVFVPEDSY